MAKTYKAVEVSFSGLGCQRSGRMLSQSHDAVARDQRAAGLGTLRGLPDILVGSQPKPNSCDSNAELMFGFATDRTDTSHEDEENVCLALVSPNSRLVLHRPYAAITTMILVSVPGRAADMQVRVWGSGEHHHGSGVPHPSRKTRSFCIKGPKDHPVRT